MNQNVTKQRPALDHIIYNFPKHANTHLIDALWVMLSCTQNLQVRCQGLTVSTAQICGQINSGHVTSITSMHWAIKPINNSTTHLLFKKFKLLATIDCELSSLEVTKSKYNANSAKYCGDIPTWNESCPCDHIDLNLINGWVYDEMIFILSYSISKHISLTLFSICQPVESTTLARLLIGQDMIPRATINTFLTVQVERMKLIYTQFQSVKKGKYPTARFHNGNVTMTIQKLTFMFALNLWVVNPQIPVHVPMENISFNLTLHDFYRNIMYGKNTVNRTIFIINV